MSKKRFTDAEKWRDPWFRGLPDAGKIAWMYLCDTCDAAGVWVVDAAGFGFETGLKATLDEVYALLVGRVRMLDATRWHLVKFVAFQYPNGLNPKVVAQLACARQIQKHGMPIPWINGIPIPSGMGHPCPIDTDTNTATATDTNAREAPPVTPLPISETKPGIMDLRFIAGLKLLPNSHPDWLALLDEVGLEPIRQARDELAKAGKECWVSDVGAAAIRIHANRRKQIVDLEAQERQQSASSEASLRLEAERIAGHEEAERFLASLVADGRVADCPPSFLADLRAGMANRDRGSRVHGPLGPLAKLRKHLNALPVAGRTA